MRGSVIPLSHSLRTFSFFLFIAVAIEVIKLTVKGAVFVFTLPILLATIPTSLWYREALSFIKIFFALCYHERSRTLLTFRFHLF